MSVSVDYYFILNSPWSYMANVQLPDLLHRYNVELKLKPVRMGPLLEATGGLPLAKRSAQRQAYRLQELGRWARRLNIPLNLEPAHFPVDERLAAGVVIAAMEDGHYGLELAEAFGAAIWVQNHDLADEAVIGEILASEGLPSLLINESRTQAIDEVLDKNTEEAIAAGVFGVPTFIVADHVFWGQDRIDFLEEAIRQAS